MTSLQLQGISRQNLVWGDLLGIILEVGLIWSGKKLCSLSQSLTLVSFSLDTAALLFQEIQDRIWVASHHPLPRILGECLGEGDSPACDRGMIQSRMLVISIALWSGRGVQGPGSASG